MGQVHMRGGSVSQNAVEQTLGKLATDEEFRARFFENPAAATWEAGLPLSPIELEALSGLSRAAIARFSQSLDGASAGCVSVGPRSPRCRGSKVARRERDERRRHAPPPGAGAVRRGG